MPLQLPHLTAVIVSAPRSDWFPGTVTPTRPGIYERTSDPAGREDKIFFAYWDGSVWCVGSRMFGRAQLLTRVSKSQTGWQWRGLAQETTVPPHDYREGMYPPREHTIVPPEGGWKSHADYRVLVAFHRGCEIRWGTMRTGWLSVTDAPQIYITDGAGEHAFSLNDVHFLKAFLVA